MVAQYGTLLDQAIGCQIVRVEMLPIACQQCLFTVADEVARVDRQILKEELLYDLRMLAWLLCLIAPQMDQLGFAVETCRHQPILAWVQSHRSHDTLVLALRIGVPKLRELKGAAL